MADYEVGLESEISNFLDQDLYLLKKFFAKSEGSSLPEIMKSTVPSKAKKG